MQTQTIKIGTQVTSAKLGKGIVTTILSKQKNYYEIRFGNSLKKVMLQYSDVTIDEVQDLNIIKETSTEIKAAKKEVKSTAKKYHGLDSFEIIKETEKAILVRCKAEKGIHSQSSQLSDFWFPKYVTKIDDNKLLVKSEFVLSNILNDRFDNKLQPFYTFTI